MMTASLSTSEVNWISHHSKTKSSKSEMSSIWSWEICVGNLSENLRRSKARLWTKATHTWVIRRRSAKLRCPGCKTASTSESMNKSRNWNKMLKLIVRTMNLTRRTSSSGRKPKLNGKSRMNGLKRSVNTNDRKRTIGTTISRLSRRSRTPSTKSEFFRRSKMKKIRLYRSLKRTEQTWGRGNKTSSGREVKIRRIRKMQMMRE